MLRTFTAGSMTALLLLGTTACGGAEDLLDDATSAAACAAARQAVAPIQDGARAAIQELGVDPAGAQRELQVLKKAVDAATSGVSGEVRQSLQAISGDLGALIDQARAAARGSIDQQAVDQAQDELGAAIDEVTQIC